MVRIGICDDAADARMALRAVLEQILERNRSQAQIFEFSGGEGLLRWHERHLGELDAVFLDLEMGELNGMEAAKCLRAADPGLQIVFVTAYADQVFRGYAVGAAGYLLKPVDPVLLAETLERIQAALCRELDRAFLCRNGEIRYRIPLQEIRYFASDRRQVTCVADDRTYTFYGKLDDVAAETGPSFVRIHQRYLVRAGAVEQVENGQVVLKDGRSLPISRSCRQAALAALTRAELEGSP